MTPEEDATLGTNTAQSIAARLESCLPELRRKYGLDRIRIYGSFARGEATPESDIDLLVEFHGVPSLFDLVHLQDELEAILGRRVDIATPGGMHPLVLESAEADAVDVGARM